jgi:hypothetical protein
MGLCRRKLSQRQQQKYKAQKVMLDNKTHRLLVEQWEQRVSMHVERAIAPKQGACGRSEPSRAARGGSPWSLRATGECWPCGRALRAAIQATRIALRHAYTVSNVMRWK